MTRLARGVGLVAILAVITLGGCAQDGDVTLSGGNPTPTDADETGTQTPQDIASQKVFQFVNGRNSLNKDPGKYTDPQGIGFAETTLAQQYIAESLELKDKGHRQEGDAQLVDDPTVGTVDLNPDDVKGEAVPPFVELTACIDESATSIVDAKGKTVKKGKAKPVKMKFHVVNRAWPSEGAWRIAWTKPVTGAC